MNKFIVALRNQIDNFKPEKAEELSIQIHNAEIEGYLVSEIEDKYWSRLTELLQNYYHKNNRH